jgi:hypothetical protein
MEEFHSPFIRVTKKLIFYNKVFNFHSKMVVTGRKFHLNLPIICSKRNDSVPIDTTLWIIWQNMALK